MPRLFTSSDVERAARLAAQTAANAVVANLRFGQDAPNLEEAVRGAVAMIADDTPPFFSEEDVKLMLQFILEKEDVEAEFEDAVATALRR